MPNELQPKRARPLLERMARAVLENREEYSAEERERVRFALEQRPDELRHILDGIHAAHEGGRDEEG
jgi:hypothetical protein